MLEGRKPTVAESVTRGRPQALDPGGRAKNVGLEVALRHLSPKRKTNGPGLDGWYPYYAGFSYEFVASILPELTNKRGAVVLDPWNGSGTTTAAALHNGHIPLGMDLNPSIVAIANAKLVTSSELAQVTPLLERCLQASDCAVEAGRIRTPGALGRWLPKTAARFGEAAVAWLLSHDEVEAAQHLQPGTALATLCVLHGLRKWGVDSTKSNATWVRPNTNLRTVRRSQLRSTILQHAARVSQDSQLCPNSRPRRCAVRVGDARFLGLRNATVDVVLGSPPYCTRVDYAKQTGLELAALCGLTEITSRDLRHSLMGTTTIRVDSSVRSVLPRGVRDLLDTIRGHGSHRSAEYYARNFSQYYEDAAQAVAELARVLRPGGNALLVLQNSYYKEIEIELSRHYCELGKAVGLNASILARHPVRKAMTAINRRAQKYRSTREYSEDVVLLEKPRA